MKDVQKELLAISTALSSLVAKVEKMVEAIETESGKAAPAVKAKPAKKAKATAKKAKATAKKAKATAKKAKAAPKKRAAKKQAPTTEEGAQAPTAAPTAESQQTMLDNIFVMISRSRNGITVEKLKKRTGLEARQVSNALYKLTKKGKIETLSRGVYVKKKS
jgi:predicted Rossmann fold nucleotide-binding protein DprA/Smf involved in DNA uptake